MVIAFDTFFLARHFRNCGIYEYAKNLLVEFKELAKGDDSFEIRYFSSPGYSDDVAGLGSACGFRSVDTQLLPRGKLWRLGLSSLAAYRTEADILFSPSPNIVPWGRLPVAVTIHDAMPAKLPAELVENRIRLKGMAWLAAKLCDRIITDSEHSKKDLIEAYGLPSDKVSVVYLGYDRRTFNHLPADPEAQRLLHRKLGIRSPYVLHHGMVQLQKTWGGWSRPTKSS